MSSASSVKTLRLDYRLDPGRDQAWRLAEISRGNDAVLDFLRKHTGLTDADLFAFNLAYEELASNVARHAVVPGGGVVHLLVRLDASDSLVSLRISDDGPAFDPLSAPPRKPGAEGGEGLRLIRHYFPDMRYNYENRRNMVHLEKAL